MISNPSLLIGQACRENVCLVAAEWPVPPSGASRQEVRAHTFAKEDRQYSIRVNIIAPGLVDTELGELLVQRLRGMESILDAQKNAPFSFVCKPEDIAEAVVYLCSDAGRYVTTSASS